MKMQSIFAQLNAQEIEQKTYQYYLDEKWKPLIKYGKDVAKSGYDEYYFNLRLGIAYFKKFNYYKAADYFKKALKNDANSDVANEYLYWCNLFVDDEKKAAEYYALLPIDVQNKIKYTPRKILESVFVEGGLKISDRQQQAKNLGYVNVGLNHKFSSTFSFYHAYTYQQQTQLWGNFKQHQYYFSPTVSFKNRWRLTFGFHYAHYASNLSLQTDKINKNPKPIIPPPAGTSFFDSTIYTHEYMPGDFVSNSLYSQISVSKSIKRFNFNIHAGLFAEFNKPNYRLTARDSINVREMQAQVLISENNYIRFHDSLVNKKETVLAYSAGIGLYYNFPRVTIGADLSTIISQKKAYFVCSPSISALLAKRFILSSSFTYKGYYPMALNDAYFLLNSYDKIHYKLSATGTIIASKHINVYATYQFENIEQILLPSRYNLHSVLVGLKFTL
jgi:hypothetical protein